MVDQQSVALELEHKLTFIESTPTGDISGATNEILICLRNTNGYYVRLERHRLVEPEKREVVFEGPIVELRIGHDDLHASLLMEVRLGFRGEVVFAQTEQQVARRYAETETGKRLIINRVTAVTKQIYQRSSGIY